MRLYRIMLLLIVVCYQQTLSSEFSDTVLLQSGFRSLSDYAKVNALNKEAKNRLDRLNIDVFDYLKYANEIATKLKNKDLIFKTYLNYGYYYKLKKEYYRLPNYFGIIPRCYQMLGRQKYEINRKMLPNVIKKKELL